MRTIVFAALLLVAVFLPLVALPLAPFTIAAPLLIAFVTGACRVIPRPLLEAAPAGPRAPPSL